MPGKTMNELIDEVRGQTEEVERISDSADAATMLAVSLLQRSVVKALNGAMLRGLPNLGTGSDSYRAVNVLAKLPDRKLLHVHQSLVIDRDGSLAVVMFGRDEILTSPADLADIRKEDLGKIAAGYEFAMRRHLAKLSPVNERNRRIESLAESIERAISQSGHGRMWS